MFKRSIFFFLILPSFVLAYQSPGMPIGYVSDFVGVLNSEQREIIEKKLQNFKQETGDEISVVIIKSLRSDTIENYAVSLFKEWGIGKKSYDNGVLLLIALDDYKMRIEVGYGLEGRLTDIQSSEVIKSILRPNFQAGNFFKGIDLATDRVISEIREENINVVGIHSGLDLETILNFAFFVFIFFIWLSAVLARSSSWWAGGVVGGLFALLISMWFGFIVASLLAFVVLIPLGLLFDFFVSLAYEKGKLSGHIPWWAGGGHSGGIFGDHDSFGGFGGFGGGISGGGGSSGDW